MSIGNPGVPRTVGCKELRDQTLKTKLTEREAQAVMAFANEFSVSRSAAIRSLVLSGLQSYGQTVDGLVGDGGRDTDGALHSTMDRARNATPAA